MCEIAGVQRSNYYDWVKNPESAREIENKEIAKTIHLIHEIHPDKGYRRITTELKKNHKTYVNPKRVLRICRHEKIQSTVKCTPKGSTRWAKHAYYVADNILNREFKATAPNEKWVTDVTEFKYYDGTTIRKVYLSAILDLYDRRIVSYKLSDSNNLNLVFDTFDEAIKLEPNAQPLFHSDRGFQYTHKDFRTRITEANMTQSMSRVGKCIDNGPMEGFWGIIKREKYYGYKFNSRESLVNMITQYMHYYNNGRYQLVLKEMTPLEFHQKYYEAA